MIALFTLCGISSLYAQGFRAYAVVPADPRNLEPLVLQVRSAGCIASVGLRFENGVIRFDIRDGETCFATQPGYSVDVALGQFPAGTFTVAVYRGVVGRAATLAYSQQVVVTERVTQRSSIGGSTSLSIDVSDLWWNPQESGWGLSIKQNTSDQIFAVWNVYNASGQPVWYTLQPGQWTQAYAYTGPVYRTTGPYFGGPFDSKQVDVTQVGTGTITFSPTDYTTGTFSYTVDGVSGMKPIARLFRR